MSANAANTKGNAKTTAEAAAAARGKAELAAQQQREAQQRIQSQAYTQRVLSNQSRGFDAQGNRLNDKGQIVQFANTQSRESYLASRGVGNTGQIVNPDLYAKADFSNLTGISAAKQQASTASQVYKPEENYGYTAKVSPIISANFAKNPLETDWSLAKTKQAIEARRQSRDSFSSDQGGIKTAASEALGAKYSWKNTSNISQSIGAKIFSNQEQLTRGSQKENQIEQSQAAKALGTIKPTSNQDYITGGKTSEKPVVTLTKAQQVFGNKTSFGWDKDQLVRGSTKEDMLFSGNAKANQKGGIDYTISLSESVGLTSSIAGSKNPGGFVSSGNGASLITNARGIQELANKGALISFTSETGKPLGVAEGKNAGYDYLKISQGGKLPVNYSVFYPQKEKALLSSIQQNPAFFEKQPQSYWDRQFKSGNLQPNDIAIINNIFHTYDRSQNVQVRANQKELSASLYSTSYPYNQIIESNIGKTPNNARQNFENFVNPKVTYSITDQSGKILGTTSGQRARYDIMKAQGYGTKGKELGPYQNVKTNVSGVEYGSLAALSTAKTLTLPEKPENKTNDLLSTEQNIRNTEFGLISKAISAGTSFLGSLITVGEYGLKTAGSLSLSKGQIVANKTESSNFIESGKALITGGIKVQPYLESVKSVPEFFTSGKIQLRTNIPPQTKAGETIAKFGSQESQIQAGLITKEQAGTSAFKTGANLLIPIQLGLGMAEGFPLGVKSVGKVITEAGKTSSNYFLTIGSETLGQRALIGRTTSGFVFGSPEKNVASIRPKGSSLVIENIKRGQEIATPNRLASNFLSSEEYFAQLSKIGKASRGEVEGTIVKSTKTMSETLNNPITNVQVSKTLETQREGLSQATVKGGLTGISEKQGTLSSLNISTGKAGKVQGSTSTEQFLPTDILQQSKAIAPAHDIDVIKSNLFGIREEKQAENLAKFTNRKIQEEQGIAPSLNIVFRGMSKEKLNKLLAGQISIEKTSTTPEIYTSPQPETAQFYGELNNPKTKTGLAKIELKSESNILNYENIPKSERPKNAIGNWRKANEILINFAKSKGKSGLRKPIKTGGEETILFGGDLVKGITGVPSSVKITTVEGRRIFEGQEKAIEFVTRKDETGSSLGKSGSVYGHAIDTRTFKSTIKGTNKQVKHTSGIFQAQTNIAKIGLQSRESAIAQSATQEQLNIIGQGEYVAPELFAGKAHVRTYFQTLGVARELLKNPETRKAGFKAIEAAHTVRYYQFDNPNTALFKWGEESNKTLADIQKENQALSSTLAPKSNLINIKSAVSPTRLATSSSIFNRETSTTSRVSNKPVILSSYSVFSGTPGSSNLSSSVKPSSKTSKSIKSSTQSSLLQSSVSGKSNKSNKPTSSTAFLSGSSSSGSSISSVSNVPFSSGSAISSSSSILSSPKSAIPNVFQNITPKIPIIKYGNQGRKRKSKLVEGPTALLQLGVTNVFASSFNINVPKNKRFLF